MFHSVGCVLNRGLTSVPWPDNIGQVARVSLFVGLFYSPCPYCLMGHPLYIPSSLLDSIDQPLKA